MKIFKRKYKTWTDEELMREVANKNAGAFEEVYDRYAEAMMNYFHRMIMHDREKAEDFTHDIFTKIIQKPHLYDPNRPFKTWLYSVANNMCKNEYKKLAVRKNVSSGINESWSLGSDEKSAEIRTDEQDFKKDLQQEINQLDEKHREIFVMRYFEELSVKEIAESLEMKEGTVKSRIFYATKKLAAALSHYEVVLK